MAVWASFCECSAAPRFSKTFYKEVYISTVRCCSRGAHIVTPLLYGSSTNEELEDFLAATPSYEGGTAPLRGRRKIILFFQTWHWMAPSGFLSQCLSTATILSQCPSTATATRICCTTAVPLFRPFKWWTSVNDSLWKVNWNVVWQRLVWSDWSGLYWSFWKHYSNK